MFQLLQYFWSTTAVIYDWKQDGGDNGYNLSTLLSYHTTSSIDGGLLILEPLILIPPLFSLFDYYQYIVSTLPKVLQSSLKFRS